MPGLFNLINLYAAFDAISIFVGVPVVGNPLPPVVCIVVKVSPSLDPCMVHAPE